MLSFISISAAMAAVKRSQLSLLERERKNFKLICKASYQPSSGHEMLEEEVEKYPLNNVTAIVQSGTKKVPHPWS